MFKAQNVQNPRLEPEFKHSERSEYCAAPPANLPVAEVTSIAPKRAAGAWGEAEAGRTAIVQFQGGIPQEWVEGLARLDPDRPPADVPPQRWRQFLTDAQLFLSSSLFRIVVALGWGALDLFGCDRDRPFARIDRAGLLWLLNGDRVVVLTEDAATIETRSGQRQTWRRKLQEPGRGLPWELGSLTYDKAILDRPTSRF